MCWWGSGTSCMGNMHHCCSMLLGSTVPHMFCTSLLVLVVLEALCDAYLCFYSSHYARVRNDIMDSLEMRDACVTIGSFDRTNLFYGVKSFSRGVLFVDELVGEVSKCVATAGSTIIYCTTIKDVQQVILPTSSLLICFIFPHNHAFLYAVACNSIRLYTKSPQIHVHVLEDCCRGYFLSFTFQGCSRILTLA